MVVHTYTNFMLTKPLATGTHVSNIVKTLSLLSTAILLSACAPVGVKKPFFDEINTRTTSNPEAMARRVGEADRASDRQSSVRLDPGAWVASQPINIRVEERLPSVFFEEIAFNRQIVSLHELASRLTEITRVRVVVRQDAVEAAHTAIITGRAPLPGLDLGTQQAAAASQAGSAAAASTGTPALHIMYRGNLKGMLDTVAARLGVHWKFDGRDIRLFVADTRSFPLHASAGKLGLDSAHASGGQGTTSNLKAGTELDIWKDTESKVKSMLTPKGVVHVSQASGLITVTDIPLVLERVEAYMTELNKAINRQVMLTFNIYSVQRSREDTSAINIQTLLQKGGYRISMLSGSNTGAMTIFREGSSSVPSGSTAFINALQTIGTTRAVHSSSVVTKNNQPVPVSVGTQTAHLKEVKVVREENKPDVIEQTVGTFDTGLDLMVMPRLIDDFNLMLDFTLSLKDLKALRVYSSASGRLEMPEIDQRRMMQRVNLRSGETLILTGFESDRDEQSGSAFLDTRLPFLNNRKQDGERTTFVITVRASIVQN